MSEMQRAAARRADNVRQHADRPRERRSSEMSPAAYVRSVASVQLRESDVPDMLRFAGVASVTERGYEMFDAYGPYIETVDAGAFDETLARDDLDVPLVIGHDQLRRIARTTNGTLRLARGDDGLTVDADLDPSDRDVDWIAPKLRAGLLGEMSFGFRIDSGSWSPDFSEYRITKVDLHRGDVSIVGWGANPHTSGSLRAPATPDLRALVAAKIAARP